MHVTHMTLKENKDRIDVEGLAAMLQFSCMLSHAFCRVNSRVTSVPCEFSCLFAAFTSRWQILHTSLLGASLQEKAMEQHDLWKAMDSTLSSFRVGFYLSFVALSRSFVFITRPVPTFHWLHVPWVMSHHTYTYDCASQRSEAKQAKELVWACLRRYLNKSKQRTAAKVCNHVGTI